MNPQKILSSITIGAGAIILGLGLQYALANWTSAPTGTPPNNCTTGYPGCDAPINVGSSAQAKYGGLAIGTTTPQGALFDVEGVGYIAALVVGRNNGQSFQYIDGNQGQGKVLMSDAQGNAHWVATSTLGLGGTSGGVHGSQAVDAGYPGTTWNVPTGVTSVTINSYGEGGGGAASPGAGGNAGAHQSDTLSVTAGQTFVVSYPTNPNSANPTPGTGGIHSSACTNDGSGIAGESVNISLNGTTINALSAAGGAGGLVNAGCTGQSSNGVSTGVQYGSGGNGGVGNAQGSPGTIGGAIFTW